MKTLRNNTTWPGVQRIMKHNEIIKNYFKREREERNNILNRFVNSALD
jgi:hypothetical protein